MSTALMTCPFCYKLFDPSSIHAHDCAGLIEPLTWTTDTSTNLTIENVFDWIVFCDIWINNEYQFFPRRPDRLMRILDLGANVGYFSLYAAHQCRKYSVTHEIVAVEGVKKTFNKLVTRTDGLSIQCHNGLVGKKRGFGYISQSANHSTSAVVKSSSSYPKEYVPYIDLNNLGTFNLIKCDIEGSEFQLIKNFPNLFKTTEVVFFELHHTLGNVEKFRDSMKNLGFNKHAILINRQTNTTEAFYRE